MEVDFLFEAELYTTEDQSHWPLRIVDYQSSSLLINIFLKQTFIQKFFIENAQG